MKNFEAQTAKMILSNVESINEIVKTKEILELNYDNELTQIDTLLKLAVELYGLEHIKNSWFNIKNELRIISGTL